MKTAEDYASLNYSTSIYKDEEGDYIATVDDLPGCIADGGSPGEAFENARAAMRTWIDSRLKAGLEIPEPRSDQEFSGRVLLRMPKWLHKRLSHQARTEGSSLNQYMVSLLAERCGSTQILSAAPVANVWNAFGATMGGQTFVEGICASFPGLIRGVWDGQFLDVWASQRREGCGSFKAEKRVPAPPVGQMVA